MKGFSNTGRANDDDLTVTEFKGFDRQPIALATSLVGAEIRCYPLHWCQKPSSGLVIAMNHDLNRSGADRWRWCTTVNCPLQQLSREGEDEANVICMHKNNVNYDKEDVGFLKVYAMATLTEPGQGETQTSANDSIPQQVKDLYCRQAPSSADIPDLHITMTGIEFLCLSCT